MNRAEWDKAFYNLCREIDKEELREQLEEAILAGKAAILLLAREALEAKVSFEDFIDTMEAAVVNQYNTGIQDGKAFGTFDETIDDDEYGA